jgi:hypothetical protein
VLAWLFTHSLGKLVTGTGYEGQSRSWVDEWLLRKIIAEALYNLGADEAAVTRGIVLVNALINQQRSLAEHASEPKPAYRVAEAWLKDDDVRAFLKVNRFQNVLWYNKESFDQMLGLALLAAVLDAEARPDSQPSAAAEEIAGYYKIVRALQQAQAQAEYRVDNLLAAARGDTPAATPAT